MQASGCNSLDTLHGAGAQVFLRLSRHLIAWAFIASYAFAASNSSALSRHDLESNAPKSAFA